MKLVLPSVNHGVESERIAFINLLVESVVKRGAASEVLSIGSLESQSAMTCMFSLFNESMNYAMNLGNHGSVLKKNETLIGEFGDNARVVAHYSHAHETSKNGSFVKFSLVYKYEGVKHEVCSCSYVVHAELGHYRIRQSEKLPWRMLELPRDERCKMFETMMNFFDFTDGLVEQVT